MKITRRGFLVGGLLGLSSCAQLDRIRPDISLPDVPLTGPDTFSFATIGDTHLVDARSTAPLARAVGALAANEQVQFVVMLGDLSEHGTLEQLGLASTSLARLEQPYYAVPGNHDVLLGGAEPLANFTQRFDTTHWRESDGGWALLGLNTCVGREQVVTVPEEELAWLDAQLERINTDRPIALFTHHPLNPTTADWRVENAEAILARFGTHKLRLVASGHYHGNTEEQVGDVLFCTTACCSLTRENHDGTTAKGFRLFHVDGETVTTEFVEVAV